MIDDFFGAMHGPIGSEEPLEQPEVVPGPMFGPERPTTPQTTDRARTRRTNEGYTPAQKKEIAWATSLEHRMNVVAALLLVLPTALGLYFLAGGSWVSYLQFTACIAASGFLTAICIKNVQASPKQVGVRTWMGGRIPYLKQEGYCLVIPFFWDLIRIDVADKNTDLSQENVPAKNGTIGVLASMTWHPDYKDPIAMIRYIDAGMAAGVEDILDDPANQGIREYAIGMKVEKALKDKKGFRKAIIGAMLNVEDAELNDVVEAFKNGTKRLTPKLVGIRILQITVPDIVLPADIEKARKKLAIEELQRKSESTERNHFEASIISLRDNVGLSPEKATESWMIWRKLIKKDVHQELFDVSGLGDKDPMGLTSPIHLLARGLQGKKGGGTDRKNKKDEEDDQE